LIKRSWRQQHERDDHGIIHLRSPYQHEEATPETLLLPLIMANISSADSNIHCNFAAVNIILNHH